MIGLRQAVRELTVRLTTAGIEEPRTDAWLLLAAATGRSRADLVAAGDDHLTPAEAAHLDRLTARRLAREPIAHILGEKEFWSLPFQVGPDVLVPRPETETVVEAALAALPDRAASLRILDLGTGSGCLLAALLTELPAGRGVGVDRSPAALTIAARNATALGLDDRASFVPGSWGASLDERFDLIVSNPPYVRTTERDQLAPEVRDHEPSLALFADADGLAAYRALAPDLARLIAPAGVIVLEIGSGQGAAVEAILAPHGLDVSARHNDLAGIERCLVAKARSRLAK